MKKKSIFFSLNLTGSVGIQILISLILILPAFSQNSNYGVNLAGLEFGTAIPGVIGTDFF
jgi:hypothetical protein